MTFCSAWHRCCTEQRCHPAVFSPPAALPVLYGRYKCLQVTMRAYDQAGNRGEPLPRLSLKEAPLCPNYYPTPGDKASAQSWVSDTPGSEKTWHHYPLDTSSSEFWSLASALPGQKVEVRVVGRSTLPQWGPARFRPLICMYDAPPRGPSIRADEVTKSRKIPTRKLPPGALFCF